MSIHRDNETIDKKISKSSSFASLTMSAEIIPKMKEGEADELNKRISFLQSFEFFSDLKPK